MGRKTIHDFPRSDTLSRERLRTLRASHQAAARDFGTALSALLRCPVEAELDGVEQLAYGRFLDKLDRTSYFNLLRAEPLGDPLALDVEPSIIYPMIDRLLGGCGEDEPPPCRPIGDVESPLAARIVRLFLERLSRVWPGIADLKLEVIQAESNPRLLRAMPSDEMTVSVDFRLSVGARQGMMRLCIPCRTVQRLDSNRTETAESDRTSVVRMPAGDAAADPDSSIEVSVILATTPVTVAELSGLRVGDIVATETDSDDPAVVSFSGGPKFFAKPGACRGLKAVRITESIGER